MPRSALSQVEVEEFREALCGSAMQLFAEHGYEGVTMRALAQSLGCSAMTPYRYFQNKAEIFDALRSGAADRFADALEAALVGQSSHSARLEALSHAYVRFALDEPHAYRIMFQLDQAWPTDPRDKEELRSWFVMFGAVEQAIEEGAIDGDPELVAHLLWSGMHGIVALHLAGKLVLGKSLEELVEAFVERELGRMKNPSLARVD